MSKPPAKAKVTPETSNTSAGKAAAKPGAAKPAAKPAPATKPGASKTATKAAPADKAKAAPADKAKAAPADKAKAPADKAKAPAAKADAKTAKPAAAKPAAAKPADTPTVTPAASVTISATVTDIPHPAADAAPAPEKKDKKEKKEKKKKDKKDKFDAKKVFLTQTAQLKKVLHTQEAAATARKYLDARARRMTRMSVANKVILWKFTKTNLLFFFKSMEVFLASCVILLHSGEVHVPSAKEASLLYISCQTGPWVFLTTRLSCVSRRRNPFSPFAEAPLVVACAGAYLVTAAFLFVDIVCYDCELRALVGILDQYTELVTPMTIVRFLIASLLVILLVLDGTFLILSRIKRLF